MKKLVVIIITMVLGLGLGLGYSVMNDKVESLEAKVVEMEISKTADIVKATAEKEQLEAQLWNVLSGKNYDITLTNGNETINFVKDGWFGQKFKITH